MGKNKKTFAVYLARDERSIPSRCEACRRSRAFKRSKQKIQNCRSMKDKSLEYWLKILRERRRIASIIKKYTGKCMCEMLFKPFAAQCNAKTLAQLMMECKENPHYNCHTEFDKLYLMKFKKNYGESESECSNEFRQQGGENLSPVISEFKPDIKNLVVIGISLIQLEIVGCSMVLHSR